MTYFMPNIYNDKGFQPSVQVQPDDINKTTCAAAR